MKTPLAFISHSSKDKEFARQLAIALRSLNVNIWLDEEKIRFGDSIPQKISEGLAEADVILILVSSNFINSSWCRAEYEPLLKKEIEERKVYVIPIRLDDSDLPPLLSTKLYVDFKKGIDDHQLQRLREEIWDGYSTKRANELSGAEINRFSFHGESLLGITVSSILAAYPVSQLATETIAPNKSLNDLYYAVDRLIDKFQSLLDEVSRILIKYSGKDMFFPYRAKPKERQDVVIANRKMLAISREMRDISSSLSEILPNDSSLNKHLQSIAEVCTTISEVEGNVCVKFGFPPDVPDDTELPTFDEKYHFHQSVPGIQVYSNWAWTPADDKKVRELDDYRRELKLAIAAANSH